MFHLKSRIGRIHTYGSQIDFHPNYYTDTELNVQMLNGSAIQLANEFLGPSFDYNFGLLRDGRNDNEIELSDIDAVNIENLARNALGADRRRYYEIKKYQPKC